MTEDFIEEVKHLIRKAMALDIQVEMSKKQQEGLIISKEIILEILEGLTK